MDEPKDQHVNATEGAPDTTARQGASTPPPPPSEGPGPYGPVRPPVTVKQGGGFGRGFGSGLGAALGLMLGFIAMSLVTGLLAVLALGAIVGNVSDTTGEATTRTEAIWGDEGSAGKIRAIPITGPIMTDAAEGALFATGTYGYEIASQLDELDKGDASAVVLLVNTPGGSVTGSRAISDAVVRYQERTGQKVYVHVEGMSASGGVYSTASADEIIADHGSLIGSIGVIMGTMPQFSGVKTYGDAAGLSWVEAEEITFETLHAGRDKDFGNPFRPMTDEEKQVYQQMLDAEYQNFIDHVTSHRPMEESTIREDMGAHLFEPAMAQEYGLIDGVMNRDEFFRHVAEGAGLEPDNTVVEQVAAPSAFEELFGMTRSWGQAPAMEARSGEESLVNQNFCSGVAPLVYSGDLTAVCTQK